jgi:hypothetical protein
MPGARTADLQLSTGSANLLSIGSLRNCFRAALHRPLVTLLCLVGEESVPVHFTVFL